MNGHVIVSFPLPWWMPVPDWELFPGSGQRRRGMMLWFSSQHGMRLVAYNSEIPPFEDTSGQRLELKVDTAKGLQYVAFEVHAASDNRPGDPDLGYRFPMRHSWAHVAWESTDEDVNSKGNQESPVARLAFDEVRRFVEWYKATANTYRPRMFRWEEVPYAWIHWAEKVSFSNGTCIVQGGERELWLHLAWEAKPRNLTLDIDAPTLQRLKHNFETGRSVDLIGQKLLLVKELLHHYSEYSLAVVEAESAFELYLKKCIRNVAALQGIYTLKHKSKILPLDSVVERSNVEQDLDYLRDIAGLNFRQTAEFDAWDQARKLRNSIAHRGGTADHNTAWEGCAAISSAIQSIQRELSLRFPT